MFLFFIEHLISFSNLFTRIHLMYTEHPSPNEFYTNLKLLLWKPCACYIFLLFTIFVVPLVEVINALNHYKIFLSSLYFSLYGSFFFLDENFLLVLPSLVVLINKQLFYLCHNLIWAFEPLNCI